jgi:hypothetical protein
VLQIRVADMILGQARRTMQAQPDNYSHGTMMANLAIPTTTRTAKQRSWVFCRSKCLNLFLTWRFAEAECSTSVTVLNLFPFAAQRQEQEVLWGTPFLSFSFYLMDTLITHLLSSIGTVRPCGLSVKTRN